MESHARPTTKHPFPHGSSKANSEVRPGIENDQEEARLAGETVTNGIEVDNKAAAANRRGRRGPSKEDTDEVSDDVLVPRRDANHRETSRSKPPRAFPLPAFQDGGLRVRRWCAADLRRRGARCASRISNRESGVLRGRCGRWAPLSLRRFLRPPPFGSAVVKSYALEHLQHRPSRRPSRDDRGGAPFGAVPRATRKRRVGIVENHYCAKPEESRSGGAGTVGSNGGGGGGGGGGARGLAGGGTLCEIVRGLERLLGEESARRRPAAKVAHANGLTMRSKSPTREQELLRTSEEGLDPSEANERYDEFDTIKMPVVRSLSKSPQSDEGIEPDTADRRRASVARCWSLDSAAASDDDVSLPAQHQKRHKLRVTRCYSSDSAVLSDEDQAKGWDSTNMVESAETESNEGRPRYWRTPSVVVSDYSDYSYLDEKLERSDLDLEKYDGTGGTPSQASSCSCLDCDELRESLDNQLLRVCRHRRHSDSCCLSVESSNATAIRNFNETGNRRNSCLDSAGPYYSKFDSQFQRYSQNTELPDKGKIEFLNIPPTRKISDCSTNSSLSGDECELTELQRIKPRVS
ncbi:hypothetical protein KM043_001693 [Ampulex compressa]|nr:hypothetical protein KM043_001693 [Ampulex compressa]